MTRTLHRALARLGQEISVYEKTTADTEDQFGQQDTSWSQTGTVLAARTYQNRNTTMNSPSGQRHRDRPVFFFPVDDFPPADARIKYNGSWYELDSTTEHSTHVVAVGSEVVDENFPS